MLNKQEAEKMIRENILPFWQGMIDEENGGFYGEADYYGNINKKSDKGCILNSRILWAFSAAYRLFGDEKYKAPATHAKNFLLSAFLDKGNGGLYWLVDNSGNALNTRKQFYNIAFGIYALSEYYLATGHKSDLELAMALFGIMEKYALDPLAGGYIEATTLDWQGIDDYRLSIKDLNCPKSMNTNLHILEAYTTLLQVSRNDRVRKALETILCLTLDKIINSGYHFGLFFDINWNPLSNDISFGHDIEGSWLIYEAALAIGNQSLITRAKQTALAIAEATFSSALDHKNGGLWSGLNEEGKIRDKKEWWPQAEAIVGFYNAYELGGDKKYFDAANIIWDYVKIYFVDYKNGDWHNELNPGNSPDITMPKADFWKCPYHNARSCLQIIRRNT